MRQYTEETWVLCGTILCTFFAFFAATHRAQRAEIEALLPQLEADGWRIATATQRIWAGERELAQLAAGLDVEDTALIARILSFVANPAAAGLLEEE
ncbi:hypothetical protein [Candidatus Viridilinea mediisalina]|uniref:Uncharacterized protein n=1 Tax=Candidatus Viridilinea mediisalina TaxID=2024553 RepID=A0A2A6RP80_9CHLR|nr:hypothetical protein [Candidatus Viridilinea mediisalina]PDW04857.1 hypothetical protein CJ255_01220 [Candidatus Viridilinea mediisalina]